MSLHLYTDLADWWPLFSPPSEYAEEAAHLLLLLAPPPPPPPVPLPFQRRGDFEHPTLLELGSGGGSLASHLAAYFDLTLTDISEAMLAQSRRVNQSAEHIQGDMRTLDLGRRFDRVLIHDAIMYATTEADVLATLATARRHCRPDGHVVVVPDWVTETYEPGITTGGHDAPDGRGLRFLEWTWDPDPRDTHAEAAWTFILRDATGAVTFDSDRHAVGLFPRDTWLRLFERAGLQATSVTDPWRRDVFIALPGPHP